MYLSPMTHPICSLIKLIAFTRPLQNQEILKLNLASQRYLLGQYLALMILVHNKFSLVMHLQAVLASKAILFSLDFSNTRRPFLNGFT